MKTIDLMIILSDNEESYSVAKMTFNLKEIQCFSYNKVYIRGRNEPFSIDLVSNRKLNQIKRAIDEE